MPKQQRKKDLSEGELIAWIRKRIRHDRSLVPLGPGDDAAVVNAPTKRLLFAIDTIAEGVDFTLEGMTAYRIGRKALAINLSDIAAMGGRPLFCVASVVLRHGLTGSFSKSLYRGLEAAANKFSCPLVGGDITGWDEGIVVTVAVVGAPAGKRPISRSGARPGDVVCVTGTLGGSILGKHLTFTPRSAEAKWLATHFPPSAMIDISDGLGVDSGHIARESGCAILLDASAVPVSRAAARLAVEDGGTALAHAVGDGEDFELLFTLSARRAEMCHCAWPFGTKLTAVGKAERGRGSYLVFENKRRERIDSEGYHHL
ncbi:MAG: thiamine-phosphate kinase [Planctomycetota bacterium]